MEIGLHDVGGDSWHQLFGLRNELRVEGFRYFVEAVPLRVIRAHHGRAHARAAALVVPQFVVGPFDLFVEGSGRKFFRGVQLVHDGLGGLGELLVVQVDGSLVLRVEIADPAGGVAIGADVLHGNAAALPIIKLDGNGRAQRDADAVANIVCDALIRRGGHVTSGAGGRGGIVLADNPGFGVEIHLGDVGAVLNAVLGLVVNLDLRMIGAEVAFTAIFRLPRQRGAEGMPSVARGAGAFAAVGIHAADAAVRPGGGVEAAVAEILHFAAMALAAAVVGRGPAFHNFAEHV